MGKIYFITGTYPDIQGSGGGALIRKGQVDLFKQSGFDTWIVAPNYKSDENIIDSEKKYILIPFQFNKLNSLYERIGIKEDYYDEWINRSIILLIDIVEKEDILFCTSGGDLGMIKLGSLLKLTIGCKFIANFHDPVIYSKSFGKKVKYNGSNFFHINRDNIESKYLKNVDFIITSSESYKDALIIKYPQINGKIINAYFGYIKQYMPLTTKLRENNQILRIGYGGSMGKEQSPEILAKVVSNMDDVKAYFIGDIKQNKYLNLPIKNVTILDPMDQDTYLDFMYQNIDVGFFSLKGDLSLLCVPSKLYEYINIGLPMIGAIEGAAKKIIENNEFGIVCKYSEVEIRNAILKLKQEKLYNQIMNNIALEKKNWIMSEKFKIVINIITQMLTK